MANIRGKMELFKKKYVHRIKNRKDEYIFYYRRPPNFRMRIGSASQNASELENAYLDAEETYAQFHCKQRLPGNKDVVRRLIRGAAERAKRYDREITITAHYVRTMLINQNFQCAMTGIEFTMQKMASSHMRPFGPSIDRIDSSGGYVPGNVRIVCNIVNIGRNAFSDTDFFTMCLAVVKRLKNAT